MEVFKDQVVGRCPREEGGGESTYLWLLCCKIVMDEPFTDEIEYLVYCLRRENMLAMVNMWITYIAFTYAGFTVSEHSLKQWNDSTFLANEMIRPITIVRSDLMIIITMYFHSISSTSIGRHTYYIRHKKNLADLYIGN